MFSKDVLTSMTNISYPHVLKKLTFGKAVSQIFQDYVDPLVIEWLPCKEKIGYESLNKMCKVPWLVWNAIVFKDCYPLAERNVHYDVLDKIEDFKMKATMNFWITRKRTSFGQYRFLFGEYLFYVPQEGEPRCRADIRLTKSITKIYGHYGEKNPE